MLSVWPVDSLVKVFADDPPPKRAGRFIDVLAARGAVESAQLAFRVDKDILDFDVVIDPPKLPRGEGRLDQIRWRRVE